MAFIYLNHLFTSKASTGDKRMFDLRENTTEKALMTQWRRLVAVDSKKCPTHATIASRLGKDMG